MRKYLPVPGLSKHWISLIMAFLNPQTPCFTSHSWQFGSSHVNTRSVLRSVKKSDSYWNAHEAGTDDVLIMLQLYKLVIWLATLIEEVAKDEVVELLRQPMTLNRDKTEFVEQVKKV